MSGDGQFNLEMEVDESAKPTYVPPKYRHPDGMACGKCVHAARLHYYRPDWLYCKKTKDNKTQFGFAKVKSRQPACELFEKPTS